MQSHAEAARTSKRGLIIAAADYHDQKLRKLRAPAVDAERLAEVLSDPEIGDFAVETVLNEPEHVVRRKVAAFLAGGSRDDVLLLHFSCHGIKDDDGQLYFATPDTELTNLDATAVSAEWVNRQMNKSRSARIVLMLDCCHSGAFSAGSMARAGGGIDIKERFEGRGRVVLTASNSLEYAFEGEALSGAGIPRSSRLRSSRGWSLERPTGTETPGSRSTSSMSTSSTEFERRLPVRPPASGRSASKAIFTLRGIPLRLRSSPPIFPPKSKKRSRAVSSLSARARSTNWDVFSR
jgi:Caspase domain